MAITILERPNPTGDMAYPPRIKFTRDDVHLVIEVADATLSFDRNTKARLYADAGIPDYRVIDLTNRQVIVHRNPQNGEYTTVTPHLETESIAPLAEPNNPVLISTLLL
jgi:Uma2 family endonuclease